MRFRANIGKDKLGLVAAQCKVIGELSKTAMVQLSPGVFEVAVRLEEDALQVFSKLTTEGVFTSFDVKSANHDRIGLEVKMASLIHALKSCNEAPTLQIKLTKKAGIPYLSMTAMNLDGTPATIQEVPVRVLPTAEVALYGEPDVPLLPVRLRFPSGRSLSAVLDHMKALSKTVTLVARQALGEVVASVRTETLAVHTFFRELIAPAPVHDADGGAMGPGELAGEEPLRIAVNAKHLARAMRVVVAQNSSMLMCISPGTMLVIQTENSDRTASTSFICRAVDAGTALEDVGGDAAGAGYEHTLGRGGLVAAGTYAGAGGLDDDVGAGGADRARGSVYDYGRRADGGGGREDEGEADRHGHSALGLPSGLPDMDGGADGGGGGGGGFGGAGGAGRGGFTHSGTVTGALARPVPMTRYQ